MRFSDLDGLTVGLWGIGRETNSFAEHLAERLPSAQIGVVVLDDLAQPVSGPGTERATVVGPESALTALSVCDALVRSPGVSIYRPEIQELLARGTPVTTATGLWLAERGGHHVIGVTGTKGKSTTATILHHLSAKCRPTHLAGNIGRPALDLIDIPDEEWVVLELSSYQTTDLSIGPQVGVITNLYREHINWHLSAEAYRRDKLAMFGKPGVAAAAYPDGEPQIEAAVHRITRTVKFGTSAGWHVTDDGSAIVYASEPPISLDGFAFRGRHNALNLCAALAALGAAELDGPALSAGFQGLGALPHRLELVHAHGEVDWVDDSISTTPESSLAALAAFPDQNLILIAGGQDREQDYRALAEQVVQTRAVLIALPPTGARLAEDARAAGIDPDRLVSAAGMEDAVAAARRLARPGTVVLLSPAAPSYHAYANFEQRGDHFAALARAT